MKPTHRPILWTALLLSLAVALWAYQPALAGSTAIPSRPPRPTPETPPPVAAIELQAEAAAGLWASVQWQTTTGLWVDVTGWQGPVEATGAQRWVVETKDFDTGPFRWQVYQQAGGKVWGTSSAFQLPGSDQSALTVSVTATPATPSPWSFLPHNGIELRTNSAGCGRYTIAGKVLDASGQSLPDYRLRLTYPDGDQETITAGHAPDYGPAGYGFILGKRRAERPYVLQLLSRDDAQTLSAPVTIVFSGACDKNLAWVVFQSNGR